VSSYDDQFLSTCRGSRACVVYLTQSLPTYYAMLGREKSDAVNGFVGKFNSKVFHLNADPSTNAYASSLIGRGLHIRRTASDTKGTSTSRGRNASESVNSNYSYGSGETNGSSSGRSGGWMFPFTTLNHGVNDGTSRNMSSGGGSSSTSGYNETEGESQSVTTGGNEQMDTLVETNFFSQHLKTGGPDNNHEVTALWFKAGGNFKRPMPGATNNVILATFKQERQA
jgi:hypothetical protein